MPTQSQDDRSKELRLQEAVSKAVAGDRASVHALLAGVQDDVYGLALEMLGEREAAEDAAQEIPRSFSTGHARTSFSRTRRRRPAERSG